MQVSAIKPFLTLFLLAVVTLIVPTIANAESGKYRSAINRFKKAPEVDSFFNNSYGFAIFPTVGKGGIGIGGAYGEGRVYRQNEYVGDTSLSQLTFGLQFGAQAYSEIIFFKNKAAFTSFTSNSFEFGAQASAVALTIGANAKAGSNGVSASAGEKQSVARYVDDMVVFTVTKGGLMYEASIGGQGFTFAPNDDF